jgi:hypothetical protein
MRVHPHIEGQGRRIIRKIAVGMSVKMPDTAPGMMPNPHCVMAENDSLPPDPNLDQLIQAGESAGEIAQGRIVISFDHMYVSADDAITILAGLIRSPKAKISQKVKHVICADKLVQVGENGSVHLFDGRERTAAVANDVAMPEMKVGRKPVIDHRNDSSRKMCSGQSAMQHMAGADEIASLAAM